MIDPSPSVNTYITLGQYGLAGVVILVLGVAVFNLWKKVNSLQHEKDDLQERRLEDAKEIQSKLTDFIKEQTTVSRQMYDLLLSINSKPRA